MTQIYTSYFANISNLPKDALPISIALYPPKGTFIIEYKLLAPSKSILDEYKASVDVNKDKIYVNRFTNEILSVLNIKYVLYDLLHTGHSHDIILLCYERPEKFCHRHLVANWLNSDKWFRDHFPEVIEYGIYNKERLK